MVSHVVSDSPSCPCCRAYTAVSSDNSFVGLRCCKTVPVGNTWSFGGSRGKFEKLTEPYRLFPLLHPR